MNQYLRVAVVAGMGIFGILLVHFLVVQDWLRAGIMIFLGMFLAGAVVGLRS